MKGKLLPIIIGVVLLACGAAVAFIVSVSLYRFIDPYFDREIAGPTTISTQWLEIVPEEPLRPSRIVQQVVLEFNKPIKETGDKSWGLVLPDGSVTVPEVQLIDQYGNAYNLTKPAFVSNPINGILLRSFGTDGLPQDRVYRAVYIRSDRPIKVSKIIWRCYDPRDRK